MKKLILTKKCFSLIRFSCKWNRVIKNISRKSVDKNFVLSIKKKSNKSLFYFLIEHFWLESKHEEPDLCELREQRYIKSAVCNVKDTAI